MKKKRSVLIFSGGVDSTTLLYQLLSQNYEIHAICFNYGQKHKGELAFAEATCRKLSVPFEVVKIPNILGGSALTDDKIKVPRGKYAKENIKLTVVPHRNLIMIALAAGYAESIKAKYIFYGVHKNDTVSYWDARLNFYDKVNEVLKLNDMFPVELKAPFINMTKVDIVKLGLKLGVDYSLTWSCYSPKSGRPCLRCSTDIERIESFLKNNAKDPLLTDEEWKNAVESYDEVMGGN